VLSIIFFDIFVTLSHVESWLKSVWNFLVNCFLFFEKDCERLYVLMSKNALKNSKNFHTHFLITLWCACDNFAH
jgi:hypothetical protein